MKHLRSRLILPLTLLLAGLMTGCGDDAVGPEASDVNGYVEGLPSWSEFAPTAPDVNEPIGEPSDPFVYVDGTTEYSCTTTPYSITDTPDRIAIFNPDSEIMWLGSLLQGKGHRDGLGSLAELPIRQRAPLAIFIDLLTEDNAETVENPTGQTVGQAIGRLIQAAEDRGHSAGSKIFFDMKRTHSLTQASLELGVSARYLSTTVESELSYESEQEENTLTAYFLQQMFTTSVVLPQTPGDFFSEDFTVDRMREQESLGRIGPDNLPTFISNIVWGRMLMLTMTSTYSYEEMEAALRATDEALGADGSVDGSMLQILSESTIQISTVGGNDQGVENLIKTGNLGSYFDADLSLTQARPLSYTVRQLGGNYPIATVSETTQYNLKSCASAQIAATGATYKLTLDKLRLLDSGCDPGAAEVYYSFSYTNSFDGTKAITSRSSSSAVSLDVNGEHTLSHTPVTVKMYKDGRGAVTISGTAWDEDPLNADDRIGSWSLGYGYGTSNGQRYFTRSENGCTIRLYLTWTKTGDLYD